MLKQLSSKKIMIITGAAVLVIAAVIVFLILNNKNSTEAFRSIMIYDLQGNALIERADIGTIDARENLYLESGDRVLVSETGMMRLKLDNDKYITAESNTVFTLEAEGNEQDSKTRIHLEKGEIINEIQNPLSSESIYETVTPNAVMAVRGTIYGVELNDNGEGGLNTRVCCFSGAVGAIPILPDGTNGEEVMVMAGSELIVYEDGTVIGPRDIDYTALSEQALETLSTLNIGISADMTQSESKDDTNQSKANTVADDDSQQDEIIDTDSDNENNDNKQTAARQDKEKQGDMGSKLDSKKNKESKEPKKAESNTPASGSGSNTSDGGNSSSDDGNSSPDDGNSSGGDSGGGDSGNKPNKPSAKVNYTVTFKYNGSIFAVQTVPKGDKAKEPVLMPASMGKWDFDFNTPIKADTVVEWTTVN